MAKEFKTDEEKISYALGLNFGMQAGNLPIDVDVDMFVDGVRDALETGKPAMSREDFSAALDLLQERINKQNNEGGCHCESCNHDCGGAEHKQKGNEYRAENAKNPGVHETASGLQIEHVKEGEGKSPSASDSVRVHYTGKLIDGTVFDSSVQRGEPIDFPLNGVIPGWTEGLQLMKEGGKAILTIPPDLGYGDHGIGGTIPPMATLVFEVELIKVL